MSNELRPEKQRAVTVRVARSLHAYEKDVSAEECCRPIVAFVSNPDRAKERVQGGAPTSQVS